MSSLEEVPAGISFEVGNLHWSRRVDAIHLIKRLIDKYFSLAEHNECDILEAVDTEGRLMGLSIVRYPHEEYDANLGSADLQYLAVAQAYQRKMGIGGALLGHAEEMAAENGMHEMSLCSVSRAVPFYEKHGYERLSPNPSNPEMIPMTKALL